VCWALTQWSCTKSDINKPVVAEALYGGVHDRKRASVFKIDQSLIYTWIGSVMLKCMFDVKHGRHIAFLLLRIMIVPSYYFNHVTRSTRSRFLVLLCQTRRRHSRSNSNAYIVLWRVLSTFSGKQDGFQWRHTITCTSYPCIIFIYQWYLQCNLATKITVITEQNFSGDFNYDWMSSGDFNYDWMYEYNTSLDCI